MAVSIQKAKAAEKQVSKPESLSVAQDLTNTPLEDLADLYGSLEDKVKALSMNPIYQQFEALKKELAARLKTAMGPTDTAVISGKHWDLEVGVAASNPRKVKDVMAIQSMVGIETFCQIAKVNISDVDKYLTPEQVASVVDSDTGYSDKRKLVAKFKG